MWFAYLESLDHSTKLLCGDWTKKACRKRAMAWVAARPQSFSEHDRILIVKLCEDIPVELVVMGA